MESKKRPWLQALIPLATALVAVLFLVVSLRDFGFWTNQPTPGFFPIIIAVVLLIASIISMIQILTDPNPKEVKYNRQELMVILGAGSVIVCTYLIGLVPSCLIFLAVWLRGVEKAPWKHILIIEIVVGAIIIGVFSTWLQVRFPSGMLGNLLGY